MKSRLGPPPPLIDGATVLWWADTAGIGRTDACTFRREDAEQRAFAGLAIAQYARDASCYLFLCDTQWETQNDTLHRDADEAKTFAERLYPGISVRWERAGIG
jgi:hypothetical protein